jgi:hypothetical protein
MPQLITTEDVASAAFTITLAGLASGAARQSTLLDNSTDAPAAIVYVALKSGAAAPTDGAQYEVYLLRGNAHGGASTYRTDGAGAADAAITIVNALPLGTIRVTAAANTLFYGEFDTGWIGPLGPEWGIAVKNSSGQALNAADHVAQYVYVIPELQAAA